MTKQLISIRDRPESGERLIRGLTAFASMNQARERLPDPATIKDKFRAMNQARERLHHL